MNSSGCDWQGASSRAGHLIYARHAGQRQNRHLRHCHALLALLSILHSRSTRLPHPARSPHQGRAPAAPLSAAVAASLRAASHGLTL